jgi:Protein of unknown function (DUF4013)
VAKGKKSDVGLNFGDAFGYSFKRAKGLLNILWVFLPIFGWFALGGYSIRIIKEFCDGKFKQLPVMKFKSDMKFGFFMFLKAIPFVLAYVVVTSILSAISRPLGGMVELVLAIFAVPMLAVNFMKKETIESFFEFEVLRAVTENFKDYLIVIWKSILLALVFIAMMIILVGFPAAAFTRNIFLADFYRRNVK